MIVICFNFTNSMVEEDGGTVFQDESIGRIRRAIIQGILSPPSPSLLSPSPLHLLPLLKFFINMKERSSTHQSRTRRRRRRRMRRYTPHTSGLDPVVSQVQKRKKRKREKKREEEK